MSRWELNFKMCIALKFKPILLALYIPKRATDIMSIMMIKDDVWMTSSSYKIAIMINIISRALKRKKKNHKNIS